MATATFRSRPEWVGAMPDSTPPQWVFLRLFARQGGRCGCGCTRAMNLNRDRVVRDHIIALRDGGENRERNLQLLLEEHHISKTVAENVARAEESRFKAKAFPELRQRQRPAFATNRDAPFKRLMSGEVVRRGG